MEYVGGLSLAPFDLASTIPRGIAAPSAISRAESKEEDLGASQDQWFQFMYLRQIFLFCGQSVFWNPEGPVTKLAS